jgi:hypothetical protein
MTVAKERRFTRRLRLVSGLLSCTLLITVSCSTSPPRPAEFKVAEKGLIVPSYPGTLLGADALPVVPAREDWLVLAATATWLIGTQIKMDLLIDEGYPAWRASRLRALSDVQPVKIRFTARLPEGGSEQQSGTVFLPIQRSGERQALTWVIFEKGTELRREFTPSRNKGLELPIITALSALGYAVWVPDYTGMGDAKGIHEYCVPESLADSSLDGLAAARRWLSGSAARGGPEYAESGRLAILGYSEGGLAAMGTLRAIVEGRIGAPGLEIVAAYVMGAPLNLAIAVPQLGDEPFVIGRPEYQVFLALGWNRVYPEAARLGDILSPRTIRSIVPLFDGTNKDTDINGHISSIVGKKEGMVADVDIFSLKYLSILRQDPAASAYYRAQLAARLDNWTPPEGIPIILAASPKDEIVPFANSQNEYDWAMEHAPQADVSLVRLASEGHIDAGIEAFLYAVADFDRREAALDDAP